MDVKFYENLYDSQIYEFIYELNEFIYSLKVHKMFMNMCYEQFMNIMN